jgi:hypothetical protein
VLPAFPALALLMGGWLDALLKRDGLLAAKLSGGTGWVFGGTAAAGLVVALVAWPAAGAISAKFHVPEDYVVIIARALLAVGAILIATVIILRRRRDAPLGSAVPFGVLAVGMASALLAAVEGRAVVKTARTLGTAVLENRRADDLVASYGHLMQSLSFYGKTRVVQIDALNEIEDGAQYAPDAADWFWTGSDRIAKGMVVAAAGLSRHEPPQGKRKSKACLIRRRAARADFDHILLVNYPAPGSKPLRPSVAAEGSHR